MDNVFEQNSECLSNKNLNKVIMKCEAYLQTDAEVDKLHDKLKKMQLSKETKETLPFLDSYIYLTLVPIICGSKLFSPSQYSSGALQLESIISLVQFF